MISLQRWQRRRPAVSVWPWPQRGQVSWTAGDVVSRPRPCRCARIASGRTNIARAAAQAAKIDVIQRNQSGSTGTMNQAAMLVGPFAESLMAETVGEFSERINRAGNPK